MPSAYHHALDAGLREIGLELTASARQAIDDHVRLLIAWNAAINLTAVRVPAEIAVRHVVDSLSAVALLLERRVTSLVDLGSGGGFPGLPIAAALPAARVTLVDSVAKKAAFLATACGAVGLGDRVAVSSERAEAIAADPRRRERWDAVAARAVGSLAELVELGFPLLAPGGWLVAWKRGDTSNERAVAWRAVEALGGGRIEVHDVTARGLDGHHLVVVTKHRPTPAGYPRDPALRRREPWS